MRATPLGMQLGATAAAHVGTTGIEEITAQSPSGINEQAGITDVVERGQRKEQVAHGTHAQQREQIEHGLVQRQLPAHVFHRGYGQEDYQPHRRHEQSQHERQPERIQRGVIVELHPGVGHELLHAGIKRGRTGERQAEQGGIRAAHIVEVHDVETLAAHAAYQVDHQ